ncbi:hypothetical protein D3C81_2048440 [compost metagenome]
MMVSNILCSSDMLLPAISSSRSFVGEFANWKISSARSSVNVIACAFFHVSKSGRSSLSAHLDIPASLTNIRVSSTWLNPSH